MINIKLTKSECKSLDLWLSVTNPCESSCWMGYKQIGCEDLDKDGNPKCELLRDIKSIEEKIAKEVEDE